MNIAIIAATASDEPFLIPPDANVRGYAGFSRMFPESKTWNVTPKGYERIHDETDVVLFIPNSDPERLAEMRSVAETVKGQKKTLCQDSDPPVGYLHWFPLVTLRTVELFNVCDCVVTHHESLIELTQGLTSTPVRYLSEPSYAAGRDWECEMIRDIILFPTTHAAGHSSRRNAVANYAVLKSLMLDHPRFRYGIIANQTQARAGDWACDEFDLIESLDIPLHRLSFIKPTGRGEMFELLRKTALMVNLDFSDCIGHWHIDAAAFGIPTITTSFPDAARCFPACQVEPYDVKSACDIATQLLNDEAFYKDVAGTARTNVKAYSAESVQQRFGRIVDAEERPFPRKAALLPDSMVLEIGSGGTAHPDVNVCFDAVDHSHAVDALFVTGDLRHTPLPFPDNSATKIYACHCIEHLPKHHADALMIDLFRILKPGGIVHVETPNVSKAFDWGTLLYPDIEKPHPDIAWGTVTGTLWSDTRGGNIYNQHCYGYNHFTLSRLLKDAGFVVEWINDENTWAVIIEAVKEAV